MTYDDVVASAAKQFDWLLQAPNFDGEAGSLSVAGSTITLTRSTVKLIAEVLEPQSFGYQVTSYDNPKGNNDYRYLALHPSAAAASARFLVVQFPLLSDGQAIPVDEVAVGNVLGVKAVDGTKVDLVLFSTDGAAVDEYVELGGSYAAADGGSYQFEATGVRAQFDVYEVMRLVQQ